MQRPKVLLAVAHPRVGEGLETLLRLEGRYETRRTAKLGDAVALARSWPADIVVIDGALLPGEGVLALGRPALVLAGNDADGEARLARIEGAVGWLRSDATPAQLVSALDRALPAALEGVAGPLALAAIGALVALFAALLLYFVWIALV